MLDIIKKALLQIVQDIDDGNCNMSDADMQSAIMMLQSMNNRTKLLNRTEAAEYLHISQRTFDRHVHDGIIPKGKHTRGDKQITWTTTELDKVKL